MWLGAELGVARIALVLFDVDGGEHVLHHQTLVEQDGVLVVIALPVHVADQDVLAQRDLALCGGRAVGDDVAVRHAVADLDDRALVDAGALVGTGKLDELVIDGLAGVVANGDVVRVDAHDGALALREQAHAGVDGAFMLDAGGDDGRLGGHQRDGLTLHVRAHQGTVGVVVFEEGDHRRGDGDHHLGADVDIVDLFPVDFDRIVMYWSSTSAVMYSTSSVTRQLPFSTLR